MKKFLLKLFIASILVMFFIAPISCAESISSFHSDIQVNFDSVLDITETIVYDFSSSGRHGIYRDITETFGSNTTIVSITDENEKPYQYQTTYGYQSISIRIGDPDKTLTGIHTYIIKYRVKNEISFLENHDELYWNVNGTEWGVPFDSVSATIVFPYELNDVRGSCYTGYYGETGGDCTYFYETFSNQTKIYFEATRSLKTNGTNSENLTIVADFPKGYLKTIGHWAEIRTGCIVITWVDRALWEQKELTGAIFFALLSFFIWKKKGNDPVPRTPIIAQYAPPNNLTASEMAAFTKGYLDASALTGTIFELGVKGLLKIEENSRTLEITKTADPKDGDLTDFQKYVFDKLFKSKDTRTLSELKYKFSDFRYKQSSILKNFKNQGLYSTLPINIYTAFLVLMLLLEATLMLAFLPTTHYAGYASLGAFVITLFCTIFMTKKTQEGVELTQAIKGFKIFLEVTEKERLDFHNPPAKTIDLFEKMLPFAVVLHVEKNWVKSFEGLLANQLNNQNYWLYSSSLSSNSFSKMISQSINSVNNISKLAMASQPSSSGSGHSSSGFSGGCSGRGGGGGGGGSW